MQVPVLISPEESERPVRRDPRFAELDWAIFRHRLRIRVDPENQRVSPRDRERIERTRRLLARTPEILDTPASSWRGRRFEYLCAHGRWHDILREGLLVD